MKKIQQLLLASSLSLWLWAPNALAEEQAAATAEEAKAFIIAAEKKLSQLFIEVSQAEWVYQNFITQDSEALSARASENLTGEMVRLANEAARYNDLKLDYDIRRKLDALRQGLVLPAPNDAAKNAELAAVSTKMNGMYGKGKYCPEKGECQDLGALEKIISGSRNEAELRTAWEGWRTISPPMRDLFARQTELSNEGAQELGYADLGQMWRSGYDMEADAFADELDRLWGQVGPLYNALHCHVRAKLGEEYGTDVVPQDGPIPAHLLGNMWAQSWDNIYDLVAPKSNAKGVDLTALLNEHDYDAIKMVKVGEQFFSSLGFEELPETFWDRSLFVKPADRDVVCHASAWNLDSKDDIRIKMCIKVDGEDFNTVHHELGHNYYQRAYNGLPTLYQGSANDGFHEAVGDTISLSITPAYLKQIELLDEIPSTEGDLGLLMKTALQKIAFLPFSLVVDQWRWQVFAGKADPAGYNDLWWELRTKYQGVAAPSERPQNAFDPGAKYHIPGNTPYTRYFLAHILQFQFHRSLCEIAGDKGDIHRCSIYNNKEAGARLNAMLEMGSSRPWPEALAALTGKETMDATAILDYFAPLKVWLDEQNKDRSCGW
ncbi:MAG: M2 family metallopeptidase [Xanthomonadales bacterium]|nr:M2 family metallopeptidase [Xanthomonadales bacterium]